MVSATGSLALARRIALGGWPDPLTTGPRALRVDVRSDAPYFQDRVIGALDAGFPLMLRSAGVICAALLILSALAGCLDRETGVPAGATAACTDPYPSQDTSPYVLPYAVGESFLIGQGNCTGPDDSHAAGTADAFAYDIDMPIGAAVVAAREGIVLAIEERFVDGNRVGGEENFVTILHADRTVAAYFHLTEGGVLVEVGDSVGQGDIIARSGDTGESTEPHLHFQVDAGEDRDSLPVVFRNTRPHPQGLVEGEAYRAEPV